MNSSEWKEVKLGDVCSKITKGTTPSTIGNGFVENGINFYRSECLTENKFLDKTKVKYIDLETHEKMKRSQLEADDILFSMAGAFLGKTCIVKKEDIPANINQASALIRLDNKYADKDYIYYYLNQRNMIDYINNSSSQSAQPNINLKQIGELVIKLPAVKEQKAIANILSSLDEKIELNNQMNKTLEEMAQALFKRWFVDFEFPNEDGEPYKSSGGEMVDSELGIIPQGWEVKRIEEICERVGSGGTPSRKKEGYYDGEILWLKTKELEDSFIFDTEEKITLRGLNESSAKLFPAHTVMMAMYGATVGKLGIISNELSFNQATCGMIVDEKVQSYEYVYLWLLKERENIINLATGSAQQNLSVGVIKSYQIINPPLKQINDFKNVVKGIFEVIENNQKENKNLNTIRDTLLPKLMSGEIRVTNLQN